MGERSLRGLQRMKPYGTEGNERSKADKEGKDKTIVYLEILRIIAIVGVFFNHTAYDGMHHYMLTDNRINYWLGIFLASVAQCCIPVFFMITGALLLRREESIGYVYKHRVLKMVVVTALAVLLQYYWNYRSNPAIGFDAKTYFRLLYEKGASTPQWFLYAYISLLLVLPFLQRLMKALPDAKWFLYLFAVYVIINDCFPILAYHQEWGNTILELPMFPQAVMCSMVGYFLECRSGDVFYKKRNILIFLSISLLLTIWSMRINHMSAQEGGMVKYGFLFVTVYGAVIFVTVRYLCRRWRMPRVLERLLCFAGGGVFGTYLIERQLQEYFQYIYVFLNTRIQSYPAIFVKIGVCVAAGILITNLIKCIPFMRKLL